MVMRLMLAITIAVVAYLLITATGTRDYLNRPLGTDFSNVWTAGRMANEGRAALAWDWPTQYAVQQNVHNSAHIPFYGWHYPPPFLIVASLLAQMPYLLALIVWQVTTLGAAVATVWRIVPGRHVIFGALSAPVVMICLTHGHNGFLTAALLGGGLMCLDRRPWLAGLMIGCLIYKPQFGVVLPLVLLASGQWRAVAGACISAVILIVITLVMWGDGVWLAFYNSLPLTQHIVIEAGNTGWAKIQTGFSAVRSWGGPVPLAYGVQAGITAVMVLGSVIATRCAAPPVRNAVVLVAALMSTPYAMDYDYTILGMAIAFLVADGRQRGFLPSDITLLGAAWVVPLFARGVADATLVPVGLLSAIVVLVLALRRMVIFDAVRLSSIRAVLANPRRTSSVS